MESLDWNVLVSQLEREAASLHKERMRAEELRQRVSNALQQAESASAGSEIIDRLDMMQMTLTEAVKENVCTNTKCPHYNKKCRMR
jgi:hypothetical protein